MNKVAVYDLEGGDGDETANPNFEANQSQEQMLK